MGDPSHVPAGIYGKQALLTLGLWEQTKKKVAGCKDVRSALALVERGETPLGIVYATDAAISTRVKVVSRFPTNSHSPILYPVALTTGGDTPGAHQFLAFLKTPAAGKIFNKYGFSIQ